MNEELKNSPIEDFDWDAYENGENNGGKSREELTKTYDESLNTVKDKEVIEGTIIALRFSKSTRTTVASASVTSSSKRIPGMFSKQCSL